MRPKVLHLLALFHVISGDAQGQCQPAWADPVPGVGGWVHALALWNAGSSPVLVEGGGLGVRAWTGTRWVSIGGGVIGNVNDLLVFDDGLGPSLYAAGQLTMAGSAPARFVARWDGSDWHVQDAGLAAGSVYVMDLEVFDDGSGPELYLAGAISVDGSNGVARWNGTRWSAVGYHALAVHALAVYDDGRGPALYADRRRWDGSDWAEYGGGIDGGDVQVLKVLDDGSGPALYAGGWFHRAGSVDAHSIARWDGARWSSLGAGVDGAFRPSVRAIAMFDDGSGPALYAAGEFSLAGGREAHNIARWDGSTWAPLGSGAIGRVYALQEFRDPGGRFLYVGGAGGPSSGALARWRGCPSCLADCDDDGGLTFFDFLCFQNLFAGGSLGADCDQSGALDYLDFLCFQDAFAGGCP